MSNYEKTKNHDEKYGDRWREYSKLI